MNAQKGNMYGFVTHTWNPICGECEFGCHYCYMKRWKLAQIHINERVIRENLGSLDNIFVGSGCDMFAPSVDKEWIRRVLNHCEEYDNAYFFQSKNPARFTEFNFPENTTICTTIESNRRYKEMGDAPMIEGRISAMCYLRDYKRMITIEPIMDFDLEVMIGWMKYTHPFQVNIGADSGRNNLQEPTKEKILALITKLESVGINVHLKDNLKRIYNPNGHI